MNHTLRIQFDIYPLGRWRVGSGLSRGTIDRAILRRGKLPYIPGSLLKGNLRHQCERIAATLGFEVCDPHVLDFEHLDSLCPLKESRYIVDRIFGTRFEGDCLYVEDAIWPPEIQEKFYEPAQIIAFTRVHIDRATGSAKDGHLFHSEYVEPTDSPFIGTIEAYHRDGQVTVAEEFQLPFEYSLLLTGLQSLERLGSDRSTGKGELRIKIRSVFYNDTELDPEKYFASFSEYSKECGEWKEALEMYRAI